MLRVKSSVWLTPTLLVIALVSAVIVIVAPFDVLFTAATAGAPSWRPLAMAAVAACGAYFAHRSGLRLEGHGARSPLLIGVALAAGMAVYVTVIDCVLFRESLSPSYVTFLHRPLADRLAYFMLRAFNENVIYRLFVFSGLLFILARFRARKKLPATWVLLAMVTAQGINIGVNVVAMAGHSPTLPVLTYDALRYVVPGVLWAWTFLRFGFSTAEVASVGCHLLLQPALGRWI